MQTIELKNPTISSIIKEISKHQNISSDTWFRGQACFEYELVPSIFRQGTNYKISINELGILEEFIRQYPEHSIQHKGVIEWLTLMQHYGLPTRLLDWSTNLLVALYFCCYDKPKNDSALYILDSNALFDTKDEIYDFFARQVKSENIISYITCLKEHISSLPLNEKYMINDISFEKIKEWNISNLIDNFLNKDTIRITLNINGKADSCDGMMIYKFNPPHLNDRIKIQSGKFTIHTGKFINGIQKHMPYIPELENDYATEYGYRYSLLRSRLLKIKIPKSTKNKILNELNACGISHSFLYPEMEHQKISILSKHQKELLDNFKAID